MMRIGFFKKCLFILIAAIGLVYFLLSSTAGLYTGCWLLRKTLPGQLEIQHLQGSLLDHIKADKIIYKQKNRTIVINQLSMNYTLNFLGFDLKQLKKTLGPLIFGNIHIQQISSDDLILENFKGNFSGNNLKTALAQAQFKGKYNNLSFDGKLHYREKLYLELFSQNNQLKIQGQFPYPWKGKALIKEPALLNPELEDLKTTITAHASLFGEDKGNLTLNLSKGYLDTKAIEGFQFLGANVQVNLRPKGIDSKGLITIDNQKKFTFNLDFPRFKNWKGRGNLYSGGKTLFLKGQGYIQPQFSGTIDLQGQDFPFMDSKEYKIWISPKLQGNFNAQSLAISGNIIIPRAQITPITFEDSLVLSDDVAFVGPKKQPLPFNISGDVNLSMGEDVFLEIKGLKSLLAGTIHLSKTLQGPITATGQLNVKNGKYKAYGQDLNIQQGQLLFTGGLVTNPGIQLKAAKVMTSFDENQQRLDTNSAKRFGNKITVGVQVSGWLNEPKVALFSNPASLSQADILSMLILGHPVSMASKSGGQLLMTAISMNLGSASKGTQLLEQVKNHLGIDVNIKTNTSYNQKTNSVKDSTGVEIGKSLSKRIYVSYNRGLTTQADVNVLTLKYLLTKFFSIQVTASDAGNGIDLLYSSQKDEKNAK